MLNYMIFIQMILPAFDVSYEKTVLRNQRSSTWRPSWEIWSRFHGNLRYTPSTNKAPNKALLI